MVLKNLQINSQINNWKILSTPFLKSKRSYVLCECTKCNEKYNVLKQNLLNNSSKCCKHCSKSFNWDENKIILELEFLIKKLKKFPLINDMKKHCPKIVSQINKHGGINKFREKLNYKIIKRQQNYWSFEVLKTHLFKNFTNMINRGIFPTTIMLTSVSLQMAVQKHGGSKKVAKAMGCKIDGCLITSDGHYVNSGNEYLLDEFLFHHKIQHEVNGKISNLTNHRYDFKVKNYYIEIWGFEESEKERCRIYQEKRKFKENLYKKLNLKLISIEKNVFAQPLEKINNYFKDLFEKLGFNLNNNKKFDIQNTSKGCRYWNDEKIVEELKEIVNNINKFPTINYLIVQKRYDLVNAIRRNGGNLKFRKILNFNLNKKENGYWKNIDNIIKEINNHIIKYKKFPSYKDLAKLKKHSLANAIVKHGGTIYLKNIMEKNASISK